MSKMIPEVASKLADRRLILAVSAAGLNLIGAQAGEFASVKEMSELKIIPATDDPALALCEMMSDCGVWFGPRRYLEENAAWRQLIPYLVIKKEDRFLVYRRGDDIEEERLRGAYALGFGGHIDIPDARFNAMGELSVCTRLSSRASSARRWKRSA